jgi:hypothetical protein
MKKLRDALRVLTALLQELADESAYRRYLEHSGCPHSAREWRRFSEARLRARYAQSKCC